MENIGRVEVCEEDDMVRLPVDLLADIFAISVSFRDLALSVINSTFLNHFSYLFLSDLLVDHVCICSCISIPNYRMSFCLILKLMNQVVYKKGVWSLYLQSLSIALFGLYCILCFCYNVVRIAAC